MIDIIDIQALEQSGLIHSKTAGRFETVKELPKEANSFDNIFDYADTFGVIRLAYINSAHQISLKLNKEEKKASAIGGEFGFSTAAYNGINFHLAAYISQTINAFNPSQEKINEDFTDVKGDPFMYIGELSLDYTSDFLELKLGRVKVETPYANSDDIRMASNTFQGAWANLHYTSNFHTQIFYFNKWAGYDSQDENTLESQNEFKYLVNDDSLGMMSASLTYEYAKNSEMSVWFNYIDNMASISYAEIVGIYFIDKDGFHLDYGLQASYISELADSGVDGTILGAMAILHYNGLFFGTAINGAYSDSGKAVTDGFGGGPYYTSLDEATIGAISEAGAEHIESKNNAYAYRIGGGYEFEKMGVYGLVLEGVYGKLSNDHGSITEKDAIITYEITSRWYLQAIYTDYQSSQNRNTFDRALVRVDYSF